MAGFENIVRPVVFPNIRPTPKQSVRPQEDSSGDPEKGMCVIRGGSGKIVQLSYSYSASASFGSMRETERRVDEARVYQEKDDGTVNKKNFVDLEVANRIKLQGGKLPIAPMRVAGMDATSFKEVWADRVEYRRYRRVQEANNVEILKVDTIRKNDFPGAP